MDIKDVKVGMLVKLNTPYVQGVGEVELISDSGLVQVRLDGVVTDSIHNVSNIDNRWRTYAGCFEPYQDPEADMVVWDALEIGEHFINHTGQEAVKITPTQFVELERAAIYTVIQSKIGQLTKYKLA